MYQKTIKNPEKLTGIGLHTGKIFELKFYPADVNTGILFKIENNFIKANYKNARHTNLATKICKDNLCILTPEHLLSAINGLGIDNLIIEIKAKDNIKNGIYEIPIMDGSSYPFVMFLKLECKFQNQKALKKFVKIKKEIIYKEENSDKYIKISPNSNLLIDYKINFNHPMIGKEKLNFNFSVNNYIKEVSRARTFGFLKEVQYLRSIGLILGGNLENAIVLDDKGILNDNLRFSDEFVRHKILDLIGDISLCPGFLLGKIEAYKTSHTINNKLLLKIFSDKNNYEIITLKANELKQETKSLLINSFAIC